MRSVIVFDAADLGTESTFWAAVFNGYVLKDAEWHSVIQEAQLQRPLFHHRKQYPESSLPALKLPELAGWRSNPRSHREVGTSLADVSKDLLSLDQEFLVE